MSNIYKLSYLTYGEHGKSGTTQVEKYFYGYSEGQLAHALYNETEPWIQDYLFYLRHTSAIDPLRSPNEWLWIVTNLKRINVETILL
jgi:hypothetical protein